jgi:energy-coupling factor transporter ATP-binding protein EcfA2
VSLIDFWPTANQVNACIKPEAEGADEAVLLAVHQPAPLVYRLPKNSEEIPASEEELFEHLISENVATGSHIVPITGDSGVGKSHLIRLLAARLKDEDRFVVVRIPKSASLRRVIELILELLPADPYGAVREAFKNALAEVDLDTAVIRFQSAIDISLRNLSIDLLSQSTQNPTNQALRERLDHAKRLPLLLSDAATREHFRSGALRRIVEGATSGRQALSDGSQEFCPADFDLPPGLDLNKSAEQVRLYYRTALQAREGRGKSIAADVLNQIKDSAIRQSFQLNDSLGGMTLQDVILEIRKLLLKARKELVILVEDFRALTGIQETLLNVLIQEGVRDGARVYATMRSAIAVTEGYLTGRDTIATRAAREWIIKSHLHKEEEVIGRTQRLVASYLNAARWGEAGLKAEQAQGRFGRNREIGAPIFSADVDDNSSKNLSAFGRVSGVSLFPLTQSAIEYFANHSMREGDELVFKPRAIIGFLRDVLLFGRGPFCEKTFPPASIKAKKTTEDIAQWLSSARLSPDQRSRYERLVVIWGNDPQQRGEIARIPVEVFATFSLPPPALEIDQTPPTPVVLLTAPSTPSSIAPDDPRLTRLVEFRRELERWVQHDGPQLNQSQAAEIRKWLSSALTDRINWNEERCLRVPIAPTAISIPHARGSGRDTANPIVITHDRSDPDGRLRSELVALFRFYVLWKRETNYPEVDDDLVRIGNLLVRLLPSALSLIRHTALLQTGAAARLLASNSRVLGLTESGRTASAMASFLFGKPSLRFELPLDAPEAFAEWLRTQQAAVAVRPQLIETLLKTCGCYQGTGSTPNGVDIERILDSLPEATQEDEPDNSFLTPDLRQTISNFSAARLVVRAKRASKEATEIRRQLETKLGSTFDKNDAAIAIRTLAEHLKGLGAWPDSELGISFASFQGLCEEFRGCALKESLGQLDRAILAEGADNQTVFIAQLSKVEFRPFVIAAMFVGAAEKIIDHGNRHARTVEEQYKEVQPQLHVDRLLSEFDRISTDLDKLQNTGTTHATKPRT